MANETESQLRQQTRGEPTMTPEDTGTELFERRASLDLREQMRGEAGVAPEDTLSELLADRVRAARERFENKEEAGGLTNKTFELVDPRDGVIGVKHTAKKQAEMEKIADGLGSTRFNSITQEGDRDEYLKTGGKWEMRDQKAEEAQQKINDFAARVERDHEKEVIPVDQWPSAVKEAFAVMGFEPEIETQKRASIAIEDRGIAFSDVAYGASRNGLGDKALSPETASKWVEADTRDYAMIKDEQRKGLAADTIAQNADVNPVYKRALAERSPEFAQQIAVVSEQNAEASAAKSERKAADYATFDQDKETKETLTPRDLAAGAAHTVQMTGVGGVAGQYAAQTVGIADAAIVAKNVIDGKEVRAVDAATAAASVTMASGAGGPVVQGAAKAAAVVGAVDAGERAINTVKAASATREESEEPSRREIAREEATRAEETKKREAADIERRKQRETTQAMQGLNEVDVKRSGREIEREDLILPRRITNNYTEVDGKFFAKGSSRLMFEDKGNKLATSSSDKEAIGDMVAYAKAKQWDSFKLSGAVEFRREAWLQAESQGIKTTGYTPKAEDLAALKELTQERQTNAITPVQERQKERTEPAQDAQKDAPRHSLNKNQSAIHDEATKAVTTNINELQKNPALSGRSIEELQKLAYWRGVVREDNKLQPKPTQDEAIARFDKQAEDPQFGKKLESVTEAEVHDKTSERAQDNSREQQRDTEELSL